MPLADTHPRALRDGAFAPPRRAAIDSAARPDEARVRTYFLSFARKYADIGASNDYPEADATALRLLDVLLSVRPDDLGALTLRAEVRQRGGDEQDALDALQELDLARRLSISGRSSLTPSAGMHTPRPSPLRPANQGAPLSSCARLAIGTPMTSARGSGVPAPPWASAAFTPSASQPRSACKSVAGLAPTATQPSPLATPTVPSTPLARGRGASAPGHSAGTSAGASSAASPARMSASRGVLGRKGGPPPSAGGAQSAAEVLAAARSPRAGAPPSPAPGTPFSTNSAQHSAAGLTRAGAASSAAQLQTEIRQWSRQLGRLQAAGRSFRERSGPESEWVRNYPGASDSPALRAA